ncbi:hypothetical protein U6M81_10135 [Cutibacterium acnes]
MSTWFFPSALVEGRIAHNVRVQSQNGVITAVTIGAEALQTVLEELVK